MSLLTLLSGISSPSIGNGLIWKVSDLEFGLTLDPSVTATATPGALLSFSDWDAEGVLRCFQSVSNNPVIPGTGLTLDLEIVVTSNKTASSAAFGGLIGPLTYTGASGAVSASVIFKDVEIYARPAFAQTRFNYGSAEVYFNGVLQTTLPSASIDSAATIIAPAYIPFLGHPVFIDGSINASCATGGVAPINFSAATEVAASVSGGWRFKETSGGTWQTLPVLPYDNLAVPSGGPSVAGIVVSTLTWGDHLELYAKKAQTRSGTGTCPTSPAASGTDEQRLRTGEVWLVPNIETGFERMEKDHFGDIWIRSAFPQTERTATALLKPVGAVIGTPFTSTSTVHPTLPKVTLQPQAAPDPAEAEAFTNYFRYCPLKVAASESTSSSPAIDPCGDMIFPITSTDSKDAGVEFPSTVQTWTSDFAGECNHKQIIARYWQTWCHPTHQFTHPKINWEMDGSPQIWKDTWAVVRSQFIDDPGLTLPRRLRSHQISDPLELDNFQTGHQDAMQGGRRYIGVTRFHVVERAPKTTHAYTSGQSALFSVSAGTLTHGANMGFTLPGGSSTAEIRLNLNSWTVEPYQWPSLATHVRLDWTATNVSNVQLYLEGIDGERTLIEEGAALKNIKLPLLRGKSTKYAGSWAIDNGAGFIADTGADLIPGEGISTATMSDAERVAAFQLNRMSQGDRLIIRVTTTSPGAAVTINYPELFHEPDKAPVVVPESGHVSAFVVPKYSAVRQGNQDHYVPGVGWKTVPDVEGAGFKTSIVDGMGWMNLYWLGRAQTTDVTTELTSWFTSFEPNSLGALESGSSSWLMPQQTTGTYRMALVWSPREIGARMNLPRKKRSAPSWLETGAWCAMTYIYAEEGNRYVVPGNFPIEVLKPSPDTAVYSVADSLVIDGWKVSRLLEQLNNSETDQWRYVVRTKAYGRGRPWRGFFMVPNTAEDDAAGLRYDVSPGFLHAIGYLDTANEITVNVLGNDLSSLRMTATGLVGDGGFVLAWDKATGDQRLLLGASDGGTLAVYESTDFGATFTMAISLGSTYYTPAICAGTNGQRYIYALNGNSGTVDVIGWIVDSAGTVDGPFTAYTGVDAGALDVDESPDPASQHRLVMTVNVGGSLTIVQSVLGKTFA